MIDVVYMILDMDISEYFDICKDSDKLLRNRNSLWFSSWFGKYFGKLLKGVKNKEIGKLSEEGKDVILKKSDVNDINLRRSDRKDVFYRNSYLKDFFLK